MNDSTDNMVDRRIVLKTWPPILTGLAGCATSHQDAGNSTTTDGGTSESTPTAGDADGITLAIDDKEPTPREKILEQMEPHTDHLRSDAESVMFSLENQPPAAVERYHTVLDENEHETPVFDADGTQLEMYHAGTSDEGLPVYQGAAITETAERQYADLAGYDSWGEGLFIDRVGGIFSAHVPELIDKMMWEDAPYEFDRCYLIAEGAETGRGAVVLSRQEMEDLDSMPEPDRAQPTKDELDEYYAALPDIRY